MAQQLLIDELSFGRRAFAEFRKWLIPLEVSIDPSAFIQRDADQPGQWLRLSAKFAEISLGGDKGLLGGVGSVMVADSCRAKPKYTVIMLLCKFCYIQALHSIHRLLLNNEHHTEVGAQI